MLRVPFKLDPRSLNLRCDLLRPTNEQTSTRNTRGNFTSYATRWFTWIHMGGQDRDLNDQDLSISQKWVLVRRDDTIQVGWAIRYPATTGTVYQITAIDVFDEADRRYMMLKVQVKNSSTVVSP